MATSFYSGAFFTGEFFSAPPIITINGIVGSYTWSGTTATLATNINHIVGQYLWQGTTATFSKMVGSTPGTYIWSGIKSDIFVGWPVTAIAAVSGNVVRSGIWN